MSLLETVEIECPYCGEINLLVIDGPAGIQEYVEDCQVCCQPISLYVTVDEEGRPRVEARRENE